MPDYSKSIIYKLECKDPKVTEIYVGATTNFYNRKKDHKTNCINKNGNIKYNAPKYCFMRLHGGWDNWQMIQIEEVNARNKRHLNQIEAKYIRELGAELNCFIPQDIDEGLGDVEWKKEWSAKNFEKISERKKEYYEKNYEKLYQYRAKNREKNNKRNKQWRAKNSEYNASRYKEWYAKNWEKLGERVKCECGSNVRRDGLLRHKRSQKHQDWINLPEPNLIFVD
jgi:hypothetical protein